MTEAAQIWNKYEKVLVTADELQLTAYCLRLRPEVQQVK